jgi:predicted pyridoxine 5'-phosphate oxidase superfamily flavin-nucleotide-binding protein
MIKLPESVIKAWEDREDAIIFTTVNEQGMPNAIYATCVSKFNDNTFIVADNYFDKTRKNILSNSAGSILFITKEGNSYQLKGSITYHKEGEIFENMKQWNPKKLPGHAVAALNVTEVYSGANKLA